MKAYCQVCKKVQYYYNAYGKQDLQVACVECKAPIERSQLTIKPDTGYDLV